MLCGSPWLGGSFQRYHRGEYHTILQSLFPLVAVTCKELTSVSSRASTPSGITIQRQHFFTGSRRRCPIPLTSFFPLPVTLHLKPRILPFYLISSIQLTTMPYTGE